MQGSSRPTSQNEAASGFPPQRQSGGRSQDAQQGLVAEASGFLQEYSRARPEVVALWAFGIGFILGWKLKPW
jgi:hypothetical protein